MTHAEATARDTEGRRSECPGALRPRGTFPDRDFTGGAFRDRFVELFLCEDCGAAVALAGGAVLNVYRPVGPGRGVE